MSVTITIKDRIRMLPFFVSAEDRLIVLISSHVAARSFGFVIHRTMCQETLTLKALQKAYFSMWRFCVCKQHTGMIYHWIQNEIKTSFILSTNAKFDNFHELPMKLHNRDIFDIG